MVTIRTREESEEQKGPSFLGRALKIAAIAGVSYVGYNKATGGNLIDDVSKKLANKRIQLSRATSNATFRGKMDSFRNLNRAMDEVIDYSPTGLIRALRSPNTPSELGRKVASYNRTSRANQGREVISGVEKSLRNLTADFSRNATQDARLHYVKELLQDSKFQAAFGKNLKAAEHILTTQTDTLFKGLNVQNLRKEGNTNVARVLRDYKNKAYDVDLVLSNKNEEENFTKTLMAGLETVQTKMNQNKKSYQESLRRNVDISDNIYAQRMQFYEAAAFEQVRQQQMKRNARNDYFMKQSGYEPVQMFTATKMAVKNVDGRQMAFLPKEGETGFDTIEQFYGATHRENISGKSTLSLKSKGNFASTFLKRGDEYGVPRESLAEAIFSHDLYIHETTGELINLASSRDLGKQAFDTLKDDFEIPFLRLNPLQFTPGKHRKALSRDGFGVLQGGIDFQPLVSQLETQSFSGEAVNAGAKGRLAGSYVFSNGKLIDSELASKVTATNKKEAYQQFIENLGDYTLEGNYQIGSARSGLLSEYAGVMSGRTNAEQEREINFMQKWFHLGEQEADSIWTQTKQFFNKFDDPSNPQNIMNTLMRDIDAGDVLSYQDNIEEAHSILMNTTRGLSQDSREVLYDQLNEALKASGLRNTQMEAIDLRRLDEEDYLLDVLENISNRQLKRQGQAVTMGDAVVQSIEQKAYNIYERGFKKNQSSFLNSNRYIRPEEHLFDTPVDFLRYDHTNAVSKTEDLRLLVEQYAVAIADNQAINLTQNIYESSYARRSLVQDELASLRGLNSLTYHTDRASRTSSQDVIKSMAQFKESYESGSIDALSLSSSLASRGSVFGPGQSPSRNLLGDTQHIVISDHKGLLRQINENIQGMDPTSDDMINVFAESIFGWGKSATGFVGGPKTTINTATLEPWFMMNRMDRALTSVGLGLSNRDKSSAIRGLANMGFYRIGLPLIAASYMHYLDDMSGDFFSDTLADTYVNMHQDVASFKEITGLNAIGREAERIMPWMDQVWEIPVFKAAKFASFGLIGDSRSGEEVEEYYVSGEDAIRKGRYWPIGSSTPWSGDRIDRYVPNWYRRMKSDYMYSENLYGSQEEYWDNHWLPTPSNPLSPVKRFITDPYYYEEKWEESRPYVVQSRKGLFSFLRPTKINPRFHDSHKQQLKAENEKLINAYLGMNAPGQIKISGGKVKLISDEYSVYTEDGELNEDYLIEDDMAFSSSRAKYAQAGAQMVQPYLVGAGGIAPAKSNKVLGGVNLTTHNYSQFELRQLNQVIASNLTDGRSINRNDNVSQAGTLVNPAQVQTANDWINSETIFSTQGYARNMRYQASEMGGMYGFLFNEITGFNESRMKPVLEPSRRMFSMRDQFWDQDFGGLGGNVSEILRRFIPRDRDKYYNPIANQMPGWMPGNNYFINFQQGDPYSKVKQAEMRLPGEAYDKLYRTKRDAYGNYSALDRLRILADVAPYSDEYRFARKEVALLNQNGLLSDRDKDEYRTIREQVSAKSKRKRFYDTRFADADVERRTVTVEKMVDQNTFIAKEFPNNPIKLAGVSVKSTDTEMVEMMQNIFKPGQKLEIELDNNPQRRIRNDMMDTMRAVVYSPHAAPGTLGGLSGPGRGHNLNYYLSQQNGVTVKDDGSATSTRALFNETSQTIGGFTDWITHDVLPSIPILNVVTNKYLKVQNAVESYEEEVYSKSWRSWSNPVTGWIQPMMDNTIRRNPLISAGLMGGIGAMSYRRNRWKGAAIGAIVGGVLSGAETLYSTGRQIFGDGEVWIPERRRKEYEINEYFDRLTYLKYKGLYNKAAEMALEEEGVDLNAIFDADLDKKTDGLEKYLNEQKKWLNIKKKSSLTTDVYLNQELESIQFQLDNLSNDEVLAKAGAYTALALRYKSTYESTLHAAGIRETYDYNAIYRALPYKDKPYFTEFQNASPADRQRILELVPRNQRAIYQRYFGEEIDEPESNEEYFMKHKLPGHDWEGWEAGHSLDNIKIKVMKQEGIDLTEANYWPDDEAIADASGAQAISMKESLLNPMRPLSPLINLGEIENILRGAGLSDVRVSMQAHPSDSWEFNTQINIEQDRRMEIQNGIQDTLSYY